MPIQKNLNHNFFKKWTLDTAYVLGFFAADGNMIKNKRGAYFISIEITDKNLLKEIQKVIGSNHKIGVRNKLNKPNQKTSYRLQIGSKIIFKDLEKLGMTPSKSKTIQLPKIPNKYFPHFLRGYFDGDGNVGISTTHKQRKTPTKTISVLFTSGSRDILESIKNILKKRGITNGGSLFYSDGHRLPFSKRDSINIFHFMYGNLKNGLFLARKRAIFEKFIENA